MYVFDKRNRWNEKAVECPAMYPRDIATLNT